MVGRDKVKTIYLFRHGETDLNKKKIIQGSEVDSQLNENGKKQAEELAEKLTDSGIEYIYSSPLRRAFDTAKFVANKLNVSVEKISNLREISFGTIAGTSIIDINKKFGDNFYESFSKTNKYDNFTFPGGESKLEVRNRFVKCVKDIVNDTEYSVIAIASHGIILKQFYYAINSIYPDRTPNCCVMKCTYDDKIKNLEII